MDLFSQPKPEPKTLSVTQLMRRMKNLLEVQIGEVWVEGEISNLRKQASGHWYFTLKDEGAQISCAMFGARRREGSENLQDGVKVRVFAETSVYESRGQLQIIVLRAERAGLGDLQARFEALKAKLRAEGLFAPERKKPLPKFPRIIGLITSETGAALQDMLHVLSRRAPWIQVALLPVPVQGRGAEIAIARAIEMLGSPESHSWPVCDVMILARGGGSLEDLWNFNEEIVARAIARCPIPLVSAIGHETDFTIADFVADVRAPTPSAAAELVVPDHKELLRHLEHAQKRMTRAITDRLNQTHRLLEIMNRGPFGREAARALREPVMRVDRLRERFENAALPLLHVFANRLLTARRMLAAHAPLNLISRRDQKLAESKNRLIRATTNRFAKAESETRKFRALLRLLGPASALQRGFTLTFTAEGKAITSATGITPGDLLITKFADGETHSVVSTESTSKKPAASE